MNRKYLVYIILLAGWVALCYWLYANGIAPHLHERRETSHLEYLEELPYPLAFRWGSAVPVTGPGFETWIRGLGRPDSINEIWVMQGLYFRDEVDSLDRLVSLGKERLRAVREMLKPNPDFVITEIVSQEINADVRSHPFESVRIERLNMADLFVLRGDTLEVYFPLRDSLLLPRILHQRIEAWCSQHQDKSSGILHITGTADGTGVAESTDTALDRAYQVQEQLVACGWKEDQIIVHTGQRNHPLPLHNRCVLVYFE